MSVTCYYSGRWGNIFFHAAQMIAYAKKYELSYYVPDEAVAYRGFKNGDISVPFKIHSTGSKPIRPKIFDETDYVNGNPQYQEIPFMDNTMFRGYWQSFLYFDWCRDYIISKFNFPYKFNKGVTSISVRRGDCLNAPKAFPIAPREYYQNAIKFMQENGFNRFLVHSDDIEWCKVEFNQDNFPYADFEFFNGTESESYFSLMGCENNITARSTFSLTAAWMNQCSTKIVCVPTTKIMWWRSQNLDLITGTGFVEVEFNDPENTLQWNTAKRFGNQ